MKRLDCALAVALATVGAANVPAAVAGSRVFIGGVLYPYGPPPPYPIYPHPYPYPYPPPPPPPPAGPPDAAEEPASPDDRASYGLIQLVGVPDGAEVDLDGRFWLIAESLELRWLALPEGVHSITVRAPGRSIDERHIKIVAGKAHALRFPIAAR